MGCHVEALETCVQRPIGLYLTGVIHNDGFQTLSVRNIYSHIAAFPANWQMVRQANHDMFFNLIIKNVILSLSKDYKSERFCNVSNTQACKPIYKASKKSTLIKPIRKYIPYKSIQTESYSQQRCHTADLNKPFHNPLLCQGFLIP